MWRTGVAALLVAGFVGVAACGDDGAAPSGETGDPSPTVEIDPDDGAASDAVFDAIADDGPGCAAAVAVHGEGVWDGGFGTADLESGDPITEETVFDIASTSKQFTATAVLLLAEEGQLDLDAPLSDVLEGLPAWSGGVTLRQMLTHTSGIPDYIDLLYDAGFTDGDRTTAGDALAELAEAEDLDFSPGSTFAYSNSGYFLLSQVIEAVTALTAEEYLEQAVFGPLGLSAELDPVTDDHRKATSYSAVGGAWQVADAAWEQVGDGGVQTDPVELVSWAQEYWDPIIGEDLSAARADLAVDDGEGGRYGAGIIIEEDDDLGTVLSHSGAWAGFVADLVVLPDEQVAAAVTCNTPDGVDPTEAAFALAEIWRPA